MYRNEAVGSGHDTPAAAGVSARRIANEDGRFGRREFDSGQCCVS